MHLQPPSPRWPLALAVVLSASSAHAAPPTPDCIAAASESFQRREFAAAAETAGQCWQATQHPRAQFLVAMARLAQNQDALALLALERYLGADLQDEPPRSVATAKLKRDEARARTVAVTLQISPPIAETEQLEISAVRDGDAEIVVPPLERSAAGPLLRLDPGAWTVAVIRPGHAPIKQAVQLAADERERTLAVTTPREQVEVATTVEPAPIVTVAPQFPRRPWLAATSATGAALLVGGLVAFPIGVVATGRRLHGSTTEDCKAGERLDWCRGDIARHTGVRGAGAAVLAAGLGVLASGLTGLAPTPRARRIGWIVELGGGGAIAAVGATLLALGLRDFNAVNTSNEDPSLYWTRNYQVEALRLSGQYTAGAGLVGAGVGLAVGATAGLIVQSRALRRGGAARLRLEPAAGLRLRF